MKTRILAFGLTAALMASCAKNNTGWSVNGEILGADEYTLSLEGFNNGRWYVVDSLEVVAGSFSYDSPVAASFPEIMRLGLEGQYIYFPIDSVDHISIVASADRYSENYELSGTQAAGTIKSLDSLINVSVAERGVAATVGDRALKQELFVKAFSDPSTMPLYYLINKSVGEMPLYSVDDDVDVRLYGAVAQRFITELPDDPRGKFLTTVYKNGRAAKNQQVQQWEVPTTSLIDIVRFDSKGNSHSLAEMASKGDVVLLSFTAYGLETSPAYNVILNSLYDKYKAKGFNIYQIAFDGDETFWKETSRNLPWTTVWNSTTDGDMVLANYNVGALPTTFIIDRTGTVAARVDNPENIEKELGKFL